MSAASAAGASDGDQTVSFLSFNICLFPVGMRHSWPVADKMVRMRQYLELLQQHDRRRRRHRRGRSRSRGASRVSASAPGRDLDHEHSTSSSGDSSQEEEESAPLSVPLCEQPLSARRHKSIQPQPSDLLQRKESAVTTCPAAVDDPSEHLLADSSDLSLQQLASSLSADIVCLQEIFSSGCSSRWRTLLERAVERGQLGYSHVAFGRPSSLARLHLMDSGLAVLSRWPIRHQSFHPFVCNPGMLRFADKGFIHAVIEVGHREGEREPSGLSEQGELSCGASSSASSSASASSSSRRLLHVFNTHLHPGEGSATVEAARDARSAQVQQLRAYMQAQGLLEPDPAPTPAAPASVPSSSSIPSSATGSHRVEPSRASFIVLGDFNMEEGSAEHADLLRAWECGAAPLLGQPTQHMSHLFCNHGPLIAGDFAVARNLRWTQAEVVTQACALSDHFPVRYAASIS